MPTAAYLLVGTLLITGCSQAGGDGGTTSSGSSAAADVVTTGLETPWSIAFAGETPLISERDSARILELDDAGEAREVGTVPGVVPRGEGGLLGIAVRDGLLYAYSTGEDENRIQRFELRGEPGSLSLGEPTVLLGGIPSAGNHNGGRLAFGPDGMLYATTGDAGDGRRSQDLGNLGGKILRLTPEGEVPGDNPFPGSPVYSYGHRNVQGIAWDEDGTLYASEFGQNTWDELNVVEAGGNYGWPDAEGSDEGQDFTDPVQQWSTSDASPSGIAILGDTLYMAALRGERLYEVPLADPTTSEAILEDEHGRLRDVAVAPGGELWVLTNNTDGRGTPAEDDDVVLRVDAG
ncbi:PQQ-dependent sugar dehydrogenase [Rothia sp. AR01]|uniref:PQQ-dependent sugar dehydrogenase n=1 Tax=Rothia santali TaxID=2949643 RepID=A0A9X2KI46_9MICC|nr:PQQ-dependent sugar dehydrogenase [Rothia santali]MCP3425620.1 PQQ-dependent sugar dehydrogenase [Rothia santali]